MIQILTLVREKFLVEHATLIFAEQTMVGRDADTTLRNIMIHAPMTNGLSLAL